MDESTLAIVSFIKDVMIIINLAVLIAVLVLVMLLVFRLLSVVDPLKQTAKNVEEVSGIVLTSTKDVSKFFSFFGVFNRVLERVRERFNRNQE